MAWERVGDCPPERCQGRCCESIGTWYEQSASAFMELLSTSGRAEVLTVGDRYLARDHRPCQWLRDDKLCALHPDVRSDELPLRPELCDAFPMEPAQIALHPDCGFRFVEIDENGT